MNENVTIIPLWIEEADGSIVRMPEDEWLDLRRSLGIGGSDAGSIVGANDYKSPYVLWLEKTGQSEDSFTGNEATRWGHRLEPIVAQAYAEDYGVAVVEWPVIVVSGDDPFMFANLDFVEVEPSEQFPAGTVTTWYSTEPPPGAYCIVECKTSGIATHGAAHHWEDGAIPTTYYWQGVHYSVVTGIPTVTFVALIGQRGLQVREMPIDDADASLLIALESEFYENIQTGTPPDLDGSSSTEEALKSVYSDVVSGQVYDGGTALEALWDEYRAAQEEEKSAVAERKRLRAEILAAIGNAEIGVSGDQKLFTFKSGGPVESVDADRLRSDFPEVYDAVKKVRPGARTLRRSAS